MTTYDMAWPTEIPNAPDIIKACYCVDSEKIRALLAEGADVNALDVRDNLTCLHIAGLYNYEHIAAIILAHDAVCRDVDFSIRSSYSKRLAWQYASDNGYHELAVKIYQAGLLAERRRQLLPNGP